ncbi:MAG: hypothetical protein SV487_13460, partial [Thermodesulfobacteriota bacterium]|nr:hypothetical protein [Thermodesulfobacteriota bacterium]
ADGKFSEQPYCPNCHRVMSVVEGFIVTCTPCNHTLTLEYIKNLDDPVVRQFLKGEAEGPMRLGD